MNEAVALYDLSGLKCPLPVLKTRRKLAELPAGQCLWIETTDPMSVIDIPAFCQDAGHALLETVKLPSGGHRFLIQRG